MTSSSTAAVSHAIPPPPANGRPLRIGVFGGSFNPIHLGHALLAITTQQTKPVDQVVLVPVFKHAVKRDLLPFDDRVAMCRLAVAPFAGSGSNIVVSTVEQRVGASNGAMLRGLKEDYPAGTELLYICGDDFFRWMEKPKGLETLKEVNGLIVQRRLHKQHDDDRFFKEPLDESSVRAVAARLGLTIDFIYGELPHFSSTLVRRAPGHWRSFLPQTVSAYLEERPHLLEQLIHNLEADSLREQQQQSKVTCDDDDTRKQSDTTNTTTATGNDNDDNIQLGKRKRKDTTVTNNTLPTLREVSEWVMRGLTMVHCLQYERGRSGLRLSLGTSQSALDLEDAQSNTDAILRQVQTQTVAALEEEEQLKEVLGLALELQQVPVWLTRDRAVLQQRCQSLVTQKGVSGWLARAALVEKFNPRIDVLRLSLLRALTEIRASIIVAESNNNTTIAMNDNTTKDEEEAPRDLMPELLWKWSQAKEALGRQRAFVCAGGPNAPLLIAESIEMRQRLNQYILEKDRSIDRVLSSVVESSSSSLTTTQVPSTPDALHRLLENVTWWEWNLMRSFAPSTPMPLVHKLLSNKDNEHREFDVEQFFHASTTAIDFLLTFTKALSAAACAS